MNNNNTTYKDSPLGKIPVDWEVKHFEDVAEIDKESLNGSTSKDYEFNYISLSDVDGDDITIETTKQVFASAPSRARRIVHKGDVLMSTVRPNLQGFSFIREDVKNLIASTGFAVITAKKCNEEYLFQYLFSSGVSKQFYQLLVGSNYPAINSSDVRKLKLPVPSLPEQKAIAHVLALMDSAINTNNRLISKKELQKKWLMQNLLTGKKRLLNDELGIINYELKTVKLGDLIKLSSGDTKPEETNGVISDILTFPIYGGNGIMAYTNIFNSDNEKIIIGRVGEYCGTTRKIVGKCWITDNALYTTEIKNDISIDYLTYKLQYEDLSKIRNIGGQPLVSQKPIYNLSLIIHNSIEEQTSIAQVLQAADKEIQLLKAKTEKLREQKKGLMQVLLTGKKRLTVI